MIQNKVPPKLGDPESFLIPCNFNKAFSCNALADFGASINLMLYSLHAKLYLETLKPTKMSVRLVDRSFQYPVGIAENMLVEVGKFTFPVDFVILEMEEDSKVLLILERPFLHTADAVIQVKQKQLNLRVGTERMIFNIDSAMKHSYSNDDTCNSIDVINEILEEDFDALLDEDIPGICPSFCKHKIQLLDDKKPVVQKQRRLNPNMQEVVKKEILKLLDTGIIYLIVDSPWVSPIHCVPKKGGITIVTNKNGELVLTRTVTGWRVCIDYRKLNEATAKDHFLLPLMDQMLERLARNRYFYFLDGFSRRMPFGLCNAPATFQSCMLAIFHDMIEESIEVFMDDVYVFENSFEICLTNLDKMLQSLRQLFKKQDAKLRLIRWILLLQEFDIEIKERKGAENVAADHLSRIKNDETSDDCKFDDNFPGETLMEINTKDEHWFADFANYLVGDIIPKRMTYQQKKKFFSDLKHYF
nr:reverse transcriptase domain-containing protein [Tanacetum cinerariifolium]